MFTLLLVFTSALALLQLAVIWGCYGLLKAKAQTEGATLPPKIREASTLNPTDPVTQRRAPLEPEKPSPDARGTAASEAASRTSEISLGPKPGGLLGRIDGYIARQQAVQDATSSLAQAVAMERCYVEAALESAKLELETEKFRQQSERHRRHYDAAYRQVSEALAAVAEADPARTEVLPSPDFSAPTPHADAATAEAIDVRIRELAREREAYLSSVLNELHSNRRLKRTFWNEMMDNGQPLIREGFVSFARSRVTPSV